MERREFLQKSGLGLLTAQEQLPSPAARTDIVNAADFGAAGDGASDDTGALQAAIDRALAVGKPCFIPSGTYKITAPLRVGKTSAPARSQAFRLYGTGKAVRGGKGGTRILLAAEGQRAVVQFENYAWRRCEIRDLGLECQIQDGAEYGLLFDGTEFSNHLVDNVGVYGAKTAFGILQATGGNGEFVMFNNCGAWFVRNFFHTDAGQAYVQYFHHCECFLLREGTYFHLELAGGGGINVIDFNATGFRDDPRPSNTTLVRNQGSDSCLNFFGGRIEHLTQLYACHGGTPGLHVTASFTGLQVGLDADPGNAALTKRAFIEIENAPDILAIDSCAFTGTTANETVHILTNDSWAYVLFRGCFFNRVAQPPHLTTNYNDVFNQVAFEDCKVTIPTREGAVNRPVPFDRHDHQIVGAVGRRKAFSENGWVQSGRPANLLVRPQFTARNGDAVAADPPWVHFGASAKFAAYDWNHSSSATLHSSPWAKEIHIPPHSGLYQNIAAVDLAAPADSFNLSGRNFHVVAYQAMITRFAGSNNLNFALVDSADGTVYDTLTFAGSAGNPNPPRLVTLVANVVQRNVAAHVRLRLENASDLPAVVDFAWQMAADDYDPAFAASDEAAARFAGGWGLSAESGRFWDRLALPYKSDAFGSAAAKPLADLRSDIYLSASSEKLNLFANGRWWTPPRATTAAAIPDGGRWAQGDLVYNSAAAPGSPLGWVQVTPGQLHAEQPWLPATAFPAGSRVYAGDSVFLCIQAGVSGSGSGPSGGGDDIRDGSCRWSFLGPLAAAACAAAWASGTYRVGQQVHHDGRVYGCVRAGATSAAGPRGAGPEIEDGAVRWLFIGRLAKFNSFATIGS